MKTIAAISWKQDGVEGLRLFSSEQGAVLAGEDVAALHQVGGILVKWPAALGAPPDDATVATWEAEYEAATALADMKHAAMRAITAKETEAKLTTALADENAPQEVKDYKEELAKDKPAKVK